jgi:predicted short-subunit dehydrogenase-like oxidoreductase (DUF2520 family)
MGTSKIHGLRVCLIGSGNVATRLGIALKQYGSEIVMVYSPTLKNAEKLGKQLRAAAVSNLHNLPDDVDVYIMCTKDDAIKPIARHLRKTNACVIHTAGSIPMDALHLCKWHGVLYPVQTLSAQREIDFRTVPMLIEANNAKSKAIIRKVASTLSGKVYWMNSNQRLHVHLAAVYANNFVNYMYQAAGKILEGQDIPFDILQPLIEETANKIKKLSPANAQTGPAIRNDLRVQKQHNAALKSSPRLRKLYKEISQAIFIDATSRK